MAITHCKDCKAEISTEAKKCPHCGRPNKSPITGARVVIVLLAVLLGALYWQAKRVDDKAAAESAEFADRLRSLREAGTEPMKDIHDSVASDAVAQYRIAKQQGDPVQVCVQAGLVAAAFLQAKDSTSYNDWKSIESKDCRRAGVPR